MITASMWRSVASIIKLCPPHLLEFDITRKRIRKSSYSFRWLVFYYVAGFSGGMSYIASLLRVIFLHNDIDLNLKYVSIIALFIAVCLAVITVPFTHAIFSNNGYLICFINTVEKCVSPFGKTLSNKYIHEFKNRVFS